MGLTELKIENQNTYSMSLLLVLLYAISVLGEAQVLEGELKYIFITYLINIRTQDKPGNKWDRIWWQCCNY